MTRDEVEVQLVELEYGGGYVCVLAVIFQSRRLADEFVDGIERVLFPPGGRGSSQLTATTGSGGRVSLDYYAQSDAGTLSFSGEQLEQHVAGSMRRSLGSSGGLVLVFGYDSDGARYLPASENCIVRTVAVIDGELVYGQTGLRFDWSTLLVELEGVLPIG